MYDVTRHALLFNTRFLTWQPLPMPPGATIVIADSGGRRQLAASDNDKNAKTLPQMLSNTFQQFYPNLSPP